MHRSSLLVLLLPCIVCSCVGNGSNAFPNIVHWEGKYKMGLHLTRFESRILREKCICVTVNSGEMISPFENSWFFLELWNSAKHTDTQLLKLPLDLHCNQWHLTCAHIRSPVHRTALETNACGHRTHQLPILAQQLLSCADLIILQKSFDWLLYLHFHWNKSS